MSSIGSAARSTSPRPLGSGIAGHHQLPTLRPIKPSSPTSQQTYRPETSGQRQVDPPRSQPDFRIGIDFGTTNTCVVFSKPSTNANFPLIVKGFPNDPRPGTSPQVPTEACYVVPKQERPDVQPESYNTRSSHKKVDQVTETSRKIPLKDPQKRKASQHPIDNMHKFGYEATELEMQANLATDELCVPVRRMKLLLDESPHSKLTREKLRDDLQTLRQAGIIDRDEEVITDALEDVLKHTKEYLETEHGFNNAKHSVEFVLCVPVCWRAKANAIMADCLETARHRVQFGTSNASSLFMVNEAEAAAVYTLLGNVHNIDMGDYILLVDCGGGTTDVGLYSIGRTAPPRLEIEHSRPVGIAVGATDLNDKMKERAIALLTEAQWQEGGPHGTIDSIVDQEIMGKFETQYKRSFNINNSQQKFTWLIRGLKKSSIHKQLQDGRFVFDYDDMWSVFEPSIAAIKTLVGNELRHNFDFNTFARDERRRDLKKVVLVGGYGDSPALKQSLENLLRDLTGEFNARSQEFERPSQRITTDLRLIRTPEDTGVAGVATGALERASDKRYGPRRVPYLSYGVLRHIQHDPDVNEDWMKQRFRTNEKDRIDEITNTVLWLIKAGQGPLQREHRASFLSEFHFTPRQRNWEAMQNLYVSDTCTKDNYKLRHPNNKGKLKKLGKIKLFLTHLKGRVPLTIPEAPGKPHYCVNIRTEMVLVDRNMSFSVYYPATEDRLLPGSETTIQMAAAFLPGTA